MVFPNCVANAAAGHVALAFGLKGPSSTQLEREAGAFAALDQGLRWLSSGMARAVLVIGTDGLFPLQLELLRRTGLVRRHGLPQAGGGGFLPGEGAQAFLLEPRADAEARGARIRATVAALAGSSGVPEAALQRAAEGVLTGSPEVWIGGASGNKGLDALEGALAAAHPELPPPGHPKRLWGEFCGAGGQLLAAALLTPSASTLVTAPSSLGVQYACCLRDVRV
jgi:3-oxoacyl-[acyl-carrier-protein] synthase II